MLARIKLHLRRLMQMTAALVATLFAAPHAPAEPIFRADETRPLDALVLFDGTSKSHWTKMDGSQPVDWIVRDGYMEVRGGNIRTRQSFTDFQLHLEFWLPLMEDAEGQQRANSGVYLQGSYEVQILDSYDQPPLIDGCGAIYGVAEPRVNANRPPEQWQTFDIFFRAPRFDSEGNKTENARISVLQNGVWIHHDVEVPEPTTAAMDRDVRLPGPIMLQDHGNPLRFRNIWIRPVN